jgi:hypothetical protein
MAGYSVTPLAKKLGIKPGSHVFIGDAPPEYLTLLDPMPEGVELDRRPGRETDVIQLFVTSKAELARALKRMLGKMRLDAAVWISWPKKASGVATDITEDTIRAVALPLGLVDIKVCAVDATWSGLKLVIRKELRAAAEGRPKTVKTGRAR